MAWTNIAVFLVHGFARAFCDECQHDFLIAYSCKGRRVCPACNARRMVETAAHLADHVMLRLPVRQWVLSVPKRVRYSLHSDPALQTLALHIFLSAVEQGAWGRVRHRGSAPSPSSTALAPCSIPSHLHVRFGVTPLARHEPALKLRCRSVFTALWLHVAAVLGLMRLAGSALAWIYPEHRGIAVLAVIVPSFTRF